MKSKQMQSGLRPWPVERIFRPLAVLAVLCAWPWPALAGDEPRVVASIKPVHALVAGVMQGIADPRLLIAGGASPHDYSLRPSDVRSLSEAHVLFWIGAGLETVLAKPLAIAKDVRSVELLEAPGLALLPKREGGTWEHHHEEEHEHAREGTPDPHVWLDPHNAMAMVRHVADVLGEVDPARKADYEHNAAALLQRLVDLDRELAAELAQIKHIPYFVFHDGYQYFERRYHLNAVGSIVVSPEQRPGARRVRDIRNRIVADQARCVFSEPQFQAALVETLIEDTDAGHGVLDPLGAALPAGSEAYFRLLRNLAASLRDCLHGAPPPATSPSSSAPAPGS